VIGDLLGWRGVFAILGLFGLIVTIAASSPCARLTRPRRVSTGLAVVANFRSIFADPRAKVCFISVFLRGSSSTPVSYVALLCLRRRDPRASIAGL